MRRPGPLQELPIEMFAPTGSNPRGHAGFFKSPLKRARSPVASTFLSPTKRRILNEEGIFTSARQSRTTSRGMASPARFANALLGPGSPAKRLDFGALSSTSSTSQHNTMSTSSTVATGTSSSTRDSTPSRVPPSSSSTKLAPSPEFKSKSHSSLLFVEPGRYSHPPSLQSNPIAMMIPREPPPPPDPQSFHYPGFIVHPDAHILLPPAPFTPDDASEFERDKDSEKENVSLRRKARRVMNPSSFSDLKSILSSPDSSMKGIEWSDVTKSPPRKKVATCGIQRSRLPQIGIDLAMLSCSSPAISEKERRDRRRLLEEEMDGDECDDDEEML